MTAAGNHSSPLRGVIDIGTNTVLLLVGSRRADGSIAVVRDESLITRLGQGAAESGQLSEVAVVRTLDALRRCKALADGDGVESLRVVATEGLRMVENADSLLVPASQLLGGPVQVVSGDEEARWSYLSVAQEAQAREQPLRVLDIGGGSTELVVGRGLEVLDARSHPVGSVRMTERFVRSDPPDKAALAAIEAAVRESLAQQPVEPWPILHGLAGTVTTSAALLLGLTQYDRERIDGSRFTMAEVRDLRDALATETVASLQMRPCLPAGRADVIVAGITILLQVLVHCGADTLVVRDRGLRYALI